MRFAAASRRSSRSASASGLTSTRREIGGGRVFVREAPPLGNDWNPVRWGVRAAAISLGEPAGSEWRPSPSMTCVSRLPARTPIQCQRRRRLGEGTTLSPDDVELVRRADCRTRSRSSLAASACSLASRWSRTWSSSCSICAQRFELAQDAAFATGSYPDIYASHQSGTTGGRTRPCISRSAHWWAYRQ
jgi:hypothetical protein